MTSWYNWAVYLETKDPQWKQAWALDHNKLRATVKQYPDDFAVFTAIERMKR